MRNQLIAVKNFASRHRVAIAVTTTALIGLAVNRSALTQHNEFLKEHGLFDAYYNPEV